MGNFTNISFKNIDGWAPETDVDGVDIDQNVASDISVFRYKNGFLENDLDTSQTTLPTNVSSLITNGYELKSAHKFTHSTQGNKTIYILWKGSVDDVDRLRMYLDNEYIALGEGDTYSVLDEPNNINYNLVNDELKVNLNCNATYGDTSVILNLSLQYLPNDVIYNSASNVQRLAGWYICPRWLGWQYNDVVSQADIDSSLTEDFEDTTYNLGLAGNLGAWTRSTTAKRSGNYGLLCPTTGNSPVSFTLKLQNPYTLRMYVKNTRGSSVPFVWELYSKEENKPIQAFSADEVADGWLRISWIINEPGVDKEFEFRVYSFNYIDSTSTFVYPVIYVDDIAYTKTTEQIDIGLDTLFIVLAKYYNGQRALVSKGATINASSVKIPEEYIDYRISSFELYKKNFVTGIWELAGEKAVDDLWDYNSGVLEASIPIAWEDATNITLDFKYNLPSDSRVDNQSLIYSEVSYKGRTYFVKEDFKVYQSHIAGNGVIQPDSFPYSEEQGFGYFVVSRVAKNMALAISPTNDLVVFTENSFYVYQIQPSGSTVYRRLLMVSGSVGLSSRHSLAKSDEGSPATSGLMWIDDNGIYYYAGGIEQPVNLLLPAHIEYWRNISSAVKDSAVGFYNAARQEYSLYMSTNILLTYELPYKKFRKSDFSSIDEFVGSEDNEQYFKNSNILYKFIDNSYQVAYIETHYNSGYVEDRYGRSFKADELDDKILQELYVILGNNTDTDADISVQLFFDGHTYSPTFKVDTTKQYWKIPMPIIRFRRIKLKLSVNNAKKVIVRDFGVTVTEDTREALGVYS